MVRQVKVGLRRGGAAFTISKIDHVAGLTAFLEQSVQDKDSLLRYPVTAHIISILPPYYLGNRTAVLDVWATLRFTRLRCSILMFRFQRTTMNLMKIRGKHVPCHRQ